MSNEIKRKPPSELNVGWWICFGLLPIGLIIGLMMFIQYKNNKQWDNFKKTCREKGGVPTSQYLCLKKEQAVDIYP